MPKSITADLPNPDCTVNSNWKEWDQFIRSNGIQPVSAPVVRRYQNLDGSSAKFMDSDDLIHHLTRAAHGVGSPYAELAEGPFGTDDPDSTFQPTLDAMDAVFAAEGYRFSAGSKVFKGVNTKVYYEIFRFDLIAKGDTLVMPGFVSSSVCRDKALEFAGESGVLLVMSGLDKVDAIVPENSCVNTTKRPDVPEQEVILDRGITFIVESVTEATETSRREVNLRATGAGARQDS